MKVTPMVEALNTMRATYDTPPSDMAILRQSLLDNLARLNQPQMPPILSDPQRQVFLGKIDQLAAFLDSEDGADVVEVLVRTFEKFVADREAEAAAAAAEAAANPGGPANPGNPGY